MVLSSRKAHNDWKWVHAFHERGNYNTIEKPLFLLHNYCSTPSNFLSLDWFLVVLSSLAISPKDMQRENCSP